MQPVSCESLGKFFCQSQLWEMILVYEGELHVQGSNLNGKTVGFNPKNHDPSFPGRSSPEIRTPLLLTWEYHGRMGEGGFL